MRKRLAPPGFAPETAASGSAPPERKTAAPPIAAVMADAARQDALDRLAGELAAARAGGRLVVDLPLEAIDADHLVRDRISGPGKTGADPQMDELTASIAARGQQTPIEVEELDRDAEGAPRYGLISGWRRLAALRALGRDTAKALIRQPETAAAAYLAMVEENEIRAGIGHYERARIAAKAAGQGVFPDTGAAVDALFPQASKAKRSKIRAFLRVHDALDGVLRFPAALPERTGLALAQAIDTDAGTPDRLTARLRAAPPGDAAAEQAAIAAVLAEARGRTAQGRTARGHTARGRGSRNPALTERKAPQGVRLMSGPKRIELTGAAVDEALARDLSEWLYARLRDR